MGNAPHTVVALRSGNRQCWADVSTAEVVRRVKCHKCKKFFDVLWLEVTSIFNIVTRLPMRPAKEGEKNPPTEEVTVSDPIIRSEVESDVRTMLNRPANADHGMLVSEGFRCNKCCGVEED